MKILCILRGLVLTTFLIAISSSAKGDLIVNGGFESGLSGWEAMSPNFSPPAVFFDNSVVPASSGRAAADLGPSGQDAQNGGTLSQTFSITTPGTFAFSFDFTREESGAQLADFSWFLSGAVTDSDSFFSVDSGYQTFSETYLIAAPGNVTVGFTDVIGNGHSIDAVIDNVSFTSATAVPEPSSGVLVTMGLAFVAYKRRKRPLSRTRRSG